MSKIAIISDIHANMHALDLIFDDISKRSVEKIVCLGDIVTKYLHPDDVIKEVKNNCTIVIKGNCDDLVAKNPNYRYVRGLIGIDGIDYLDNLPISEQIEVNKTILNFFHSNPKDLESIFNPLFNDNEHTSAKDRTIKTEDYNQMFTSNDPQINFVGHTHNNYIAIEENKNLSIINEIPKEKQIDGISKEIIIPNDKRAIINVGSAGEHAHLKKNENDHYDTYIDPFLTYAIVDTNDLNKSIKVQIIKVPYKQKLVDVFYDFKKIQKDGGLKNAKLPMQPGDTRKIYNSLIDMGYNDDEIGGMKI